MALRTEQKLPIILSVVFVALATFGFFFYQSTVSLKQAIEDERSSTEFIRNAEHIQSMSLDLDSAVRYFVFTGNDTYLDPYRRGKTQIPAAIAKLRELSGGSVEVIQEIDSLAARLTEFQTEMDRKIELRKIHGPEYNVGEVFLPADRERIESIRAMTRNLREGEAQRQEARDLRMDEGLSTTVWILLVSSVAGMAAIGLANIVVSREIRKRQRAEEDLTEANRGLEEKVTRRTEELQVLNTRLLEIGQEREKLLTQESLSRQEAEIANRLRDEFMATVSHELRTPLNSILGWARLLNDGGLSEEQSEKAVSTIIKNSETQNRLIEDLLDVARLISGKLELEQERVDVLDSVTESVEIARPSAASKGLKFEFTEDGSHAFVLGDRNRLRQVFSNLLTNAIKFSHSAGTIYIDVRSDSGEVFVKVRDEGTGISEEFLPLVFERFRQDTSVEKRDGGLGLGLAIVRNLVEMHGGSVSVRSDGHEMGAEFTVCLPTIQP